MRTAPRLMPALISRAQLGSLTVSHFKLENGLEVVLAPDPGATSVSYTTWFRVGSRHEDAAAGQTGLAHLFEHLMFTQTRGAREAGEFDRRMEEVGAHTNAMTYYDFTAYVNTMPPDALPLAIELEADRMVNLALRPKQVETEREVVAEERLSSVEDSVDGVLDEMMHMQAFTKHPYRFPVIGLMKDIRAVTPDKALRFYGAYYAPNNAIVVAAGKLDEAATLGNIVTHYGGLTPSKLPRERVVTERAPARTIRAEVKRPVPADRMVIGFPAPCLADGDRAPYEVLAELLTGGPSSRLHRRLVLDKEIASSVNGDVPPTQHPGLFAVWVQMTKGHAAAEAETIVEAEVARFVARSVTPAELEKAKAQLETAFWHPIAASEGKAEQLGLYAVSAGSHRRLLDRAQEYTRVSARDLRRVAATYWRPGARSIVVARP